MLPVLFRMFRNSQIDTVQSEIDPLWWQIDPVCSQARAVSRSQNQNTKTCCRSQQFRLQPCDGGNSPKHHDCFSSSSRSFKFRLFINLSCFSNRFYSQYLFGYLAYWNVCVLQSKSEEMRRIRNFHHKYFNQFTSHKIDLPSNADNLHSSNLFWYSPLMNVRFSVNMAQSLRYPNQGNSYVLDALRDDVQIKLSECVKYLYRGKINVLEIERDEWRRIPSLHSPYMNAIFSKTSEVRLRSTRLSFSKHLFYLYVTNSLLWEIAMYLRNNWITHMLISTIGEQQ